MLSQSVVPPDLDDVLAELKTSIFANLNCIQIGKIESINLEEQTAEIQIQTKRKKSDGTTIDYPLLVDCPIIVMQGGGAFLEFPVKTGDFCLIMFNDRNIDNWWSTANVTEPATKRKHSLSDGFALVGINPKNSVLDLSGEKVVLNATGYPLEFKTDQDTIFNEGTDNAVRYSSLETAYNQLKTDLDSLVTKYNTDMATIAAGATAAIAAAGLWLTPLVIGGGQPSTGDITGAKIEEIKVP